ncbi:MAG: pyruvoyl-dependent arginine decarboxylase [Actinomycetota bacterium]|nr:pyruvoyl-dependent arginine decarboxylase [Actinomycetota bacterium]
MTDSPTSGTTATRFGSQFGGPAIAVSSGVGTGPTKIAAFDAALREAGVGNFNLILLSSVVPLGSVVTPVARQAPVPEGAWGDRLYVVMADCRVDTPHEEVWAGVGWIQEEETGRGLLVEHVAHSEAQLVADIESSLSSLGAGRPNVNFGPQRSMIRGTTCVDEPVCALVVAVVESAPWRAADVIVLP